MSYDENYRKPMIELGLQYQDFIMERMHLIGIVLQPFCSKAAQRKGENLFGLEIKRDGKFRKTENLYIEVAEKARPRAGDYVPSGIFRSDNTWLYGIGDELTFFVFAKSTLRNAFAARIKLGYAEKSTPTSKGFVIPVAEANRFLARKITFSLDGGIASVECGGEKSPIDLTSIPLPEEFQLRLSI